MKYSKDIFISYKNDNLLYMGRGCKADEKKAYEYYKLALEHGMEQAEFMIERIENTSKKKIKYCSDRM